MELRMTQPQPKPTLFDVDPFMRFRSNFRDQVETLKSSVVNGPKVRSGVSAALMALSDNLQNCC
ncbi:hypothetical protein P5673_007240 [Acropora cervicornis]|uniref:Uncharacterized protein n=1 Tax=Acropora cervicornis TaxID=6130 RepID=A0AAD9QVN1_ACRCE|nr:hypothetical protein P5673_007240 [Acropora cervicornis]